MTAIAYEPIEADVRLPMRRWRSQSVWPVIVGSLLLHLAIAGVLYPGGGAPPEAPAPLYTVDIVLLAPGARALPEGVNAGAPAPPEIAAASTEAAIADSPTVATADAPMAAIADAPAAASASRIAVETVAPLPSDAARLSTATIASRPNVNASPQLAPLTAAKSRVVTTLSPATAPLAVAAPPVAANVARTAGQPEVALVEQAAAPIAIAAAEAVSPEVTTQPLQPGEPAAAAPRPFVASAPQMSAARIAPPVGPPPSEAPGTAPRLEPNTVRAFQTARPALPPPPLPPRKPPSLLAIENNPRIAPENRRIVGAPVPEFNDALSVGRAAPLQAGDLLAPGPGPAAQAARAPGGPRGERRQTQTQPRSRLAGPASTPADYRGAGFWNPEVPYPIEARRLGLEGRVILRVTVSPAGAAAAVAVRRSSGHRLLDDAAQAAVRTWRFKPATLNGAPVQGDVDVPASFRLGAAGR